MLFELAHVFPYWIVIAFLYLLIGGVTALRSRMVFLPIAAVVPLALMGAQFQFFLSATHEVQLMALFIFLAGLGIGGTVARPVITSTLSQLRFMVAGESWTIGLVVFFAVGKLCALFCSSLSAQGALIGHAASVIAGALVPGIFLGRVLFLGARASR